MSVSTFRAASPAHSRAEPIRRRRLCFAALVLALSALIAGLGWATLADGGWTFARAAIFACLAINAPWLALSGATALVGFAIRVTAPDPAAAVLPALLCIADELPIHLRTALAVCVRNETPEPVIDQLRALLEGLDKSGHGHGFAACVLSDTSDQAIAAREVAAVARLRRVMGCERIAYRRRAANDGFKAGNVMSFLDEHAGRFDAMLCLDADSAMTAATVLRLVRLLQADPKLAIVQPCFAGHPASRAFARLLGLGHRQGMRVWATGQAWWQGDQGPYWGHNALIRTVPFRCHCRLQPLPDGSPVLSHDHVEAARLHRAGWGVRVLADDRGSYEGHPPTLPDMLRRDARWAAGNLQYRWMLADGRLGVLGRLQMLQAMLHYLLTPIWFAMLPLAAIDALGSHGATPSGRLLVLLATATSMLHGARLLGYLELLLRDRLAASYGGRRRLLLGAACETTLTLLLDPLFALHKSAGLMSLALGRVEFWSTQNRHEHRVALDEAARIFWPHTVIGIALQLCFLASSWWAAVVALPATAGLILAIPLANCTTNDRLSAFLRERAIAAMAEEASISR